MHLCKLPNLFKSSIEIFLLEVLFGVKIVSELQKEANTLQENIDSIFEIDGMKEVSYFYFPYFVSLYFN